MVGSHREGHQAGDASAQPLSYYNRTTTILTILV